MSRYIELLKSTAHSSQPIIVGAFKLKQGSLPHPQIIETLQELTNKGTCIHVLLESRLTKQENRTSHVPTSQGDALTLFRKTGATLIRDIYPFRNVHLKVLLSDDFALIGTTNFDDKTSKFLKRDFNILTKDPKILTELRSILTCVQEKKPVDWPFYKIEELQIDETRLSWGPKQHHQHLLDLIHQATQYIYIYQQDIQDPSIIEALEKKLKAKVNVFILMSKYPFSKKNKNKSLPYLEKLVQAQGQVRLTGEKKVKEGLGLHIHAKVLLIDPGTPRQIMYLGSANFYPPVLKPEGSNLNLGIITRDNHYIEPVHQTFQQDWQDHQEYDLTV